MAGNKNSRFKPSAEELKNIREAQKADPRVLFIPARSDGRGLGKARMIKRSELPK